MSDEPEQLPDPAPGPESVPVEFWSDTGPGFTPESSPEPPENSPAVAEDPGWTPERVVSVLQEIQAPLFNGVINTAAGVRNVDWHHRQARLEAVAPAIAREWNKVEFLRGLAGETDRAIIASYLAFEYVTPRVIQTMAERKEIARQQQQATQQQTQAAPPAARPVDLEADIEPGINPDHAALNDLPARRR